jgi:hypothetical protein
MIPLDAFISEVTPIPSLSIVLKSCITVNEPPISYLNNVPLLALPPCIVEP